MEEIVVAKRTVAGKEIEYSLILSDFSAGVKIREANGEALWRLIPDRCDNVLRFAKRLADGGVTPVSFAEIVEDYMYEL